ncbi:uncharacterized protein [Watersipora subatra]|uniref:uncharacterized protein n=1 Tax=Watersipora subatra TaxID=2589382 RepID=UPI00355B0B7A
MAHSLVCFILFLTISGIASEVFDKDGCNRDCSLDMTVKRCHYDLKIETYTTMSKACYNCPKVIEDCDREECVVANGLPRYMYAVNRQLPGPQIRVCEGDQVAATVTNEMNNGEGTSIHWHGVHQNGTVYMDGVAGLTQGFISPWTNFTYDFEANHAGTHYYHAHVGMQRADGIAGPLIVLPRKKIYNDQHDLPEHVLLLQDWYNRSGLGQGMLHLFAKDSNSPDAFLINGRAVLNGTRSKVYTVLSVTRGDTYKIRLISNAVFNCPMQIYVDQHKIKATASDGAEIEPIEADTVVIAGGERWDILLSADEVENDYWILFEGRGDCQNKRTYAILHYASDTRPVNPGAMPDPSSIKIPEQAITVNPFNEGMISEVSYLKTLATLRSDDDSPDWLKNETLKIKKNYLLLSLNKLNNSLYNVPQLYPCLPSKPAGSDGCTVLAQIDHINGKLPAAPYLSNYGEIPEEDFCDVGSMVDKGCDKVFCQCIHRLKVDHGDVVELILIDRGKYWNITNHPMHIHGQYMHVLGVGQMPSMQTSKQQVIALDSAGKISRNFVRPIKKDTIMIPNGGYAVVRFQANNLGPWLFHCHNDLHVEQGMFMVIEVGDPHEWQQNPANEIIENKSAFACTDWMWCTVGITKLGYTSVFGHGKPSNAEYAKYKS